MDTCAKNLQKKFLTKKVRKKKSIVRTLLRYNTCMDTFGFITHHIKTHHKGVKKYVKCAHFVINYDVRF